MLLNVLALVNRSSRVSDADVRHMADAFTAQIARDFAPAWGRVPTNVLAVPAAKQLATVPSLAIVDSPDVADALGYHTDDGGTYDGFIFVDPVLDAGGTVLGDPSNPSAPCVASVGSHEALELIGDPTCSAWADCGGTRTVGGVAFREVAWEAADAVEGDGYVIDKSGVPPVVVSNFVLLTWFDPLVPAGTKVDHLGKLAAPFTMDAGGYMAVRGAPGDETQVFDERAPAWRRALRRSHARRDRYKRARVRV
jgi:hypothetical protein